MKIVVLEADSLGNDLSWEKLNEVGEVVIYPNTTYEQISERVVDTDIIVSNKLPINEGSIGSCKNLKIICEAATGYNNIDLDYCKEKGIAVTNVVGYSTDSVAQHTFSLLLHLADKLSYYDSYIKDGSYCESTMFTHLGKQFHELSGKCWGIIGLGNIGNAVAKIASAFNMKVVCYSASGVNYETEYEQVDFDTLLRVSDVISIHAPLNQHTKNLMNYEAFCKMKPSSMLINVARGPIVSAKDLVRALEENKILAAGLDVFEQEPMTKGSPLLTFKDDTRLVMTPHTAWGTVEARQRLIDDVSLSIKEFEVGNKRSRII